MHPAPEDTGAAADSGRDTAAGCIVLAHLEGLIDADIAMHAILLRALIVRQKGRALCVLNPKLPAFGGFLAQRSCMEAEGLERVPPYAHMTHFSSKQRSSPSSATCGRGGLLQPGEPLNPNATPTSQVQEPYAPCAEADTAMSTSIQIGTSSFCCRLSGLGCTGLGLLPEKTSRHCGPH